MQSHLSHTGLERLDAPEFAVPLQTVADRPDRGAWQHGRRRRFAGLRARRSSIGTSRPGSFESADCPRDPLSDVAAAVRLCTAAEHLACERHAKRKHRFRTVEISAADGAGPAVSDVETALR